MKTRVSDKKIIEALRATLGKVALAAEKLDCPAETIYARARASPAVRSTLRLFRAKLLDSAETSLWKGVLKGESWAVRLALIKWGQSRAFSDGAEAWHARSAEDENFPAALVRRLITEVLDQHGHIEDCRSRQLPADTRPVCGERQPGTVEDDPAPGGDRPGDRGHDSGTDGTDPGD
jgi:hypothetical protein